MARVQFEHVYKRFGKVEVVHDINIDHIHLFDTDTGAGIF
jgi:hypothetical protein